MWRIYLINPDFSMLPSLTCEATDSNKHLLLVEFVLLPCMTHRMTRDCTLSGPYRAAVELVDTCMSIMYFTNRLHARWTRAGPAVVQGMRMKYERTHNNTYIL